MSTKIARLYCYMLIKRFFSQTTFSIFFSSDNAMQMKTLVTILQPKDILNKNSNHYLHFF